MLITLHTPTHTVEVYYSIFGEKRVGGEIQSFYFVRPLTSKTASKQGLAPKFEWRLCMSHLVVWPQNASQLR